MHGAATRAAEEEGSMHWQPKRRSSEYTRMWRLSAPEALKALLQASTWHTNGRSPEWTRVCIVSAPDSRKA